MNTPAPAAPTQPAMPTLGSLLGSLLGTVVATKTGLGPDSATGGAVLMAITGAVTAIFHWLGTKLGQNW